MNTMTTMTKTNAPGAATLSPPPPVASPRGEKGKGGSVPAGPFRRTLVLRNRLGLHHRPAMLLINTLKDFNCCVSAEVGGFAVDGRSIFGLLSLAAGPGSEFKFTAVGKDASAALDALQLLFETNFAAAYV
jgi:phosphocarrier protein